MCPNFGHPALNSSFTKYYFLQVKNSNNCEWTVSFELALAFKWQFIIFMHAYSLYKVRKPRMTKVWHGVEVGVRNPIPCDKN